MLDGPWHNKLAAGLIVYLCTAAVLGAFWLHAELKTEQRVSEYYESKTEAQNATDQIIASCLALPSVERTECVREAIVAEDKRNNETRDLHAQEWMAFWALMMFGATVLMTIVTVVGVVFVGKTLTVTREIGKAQTRAYVHAEKAHFFWGNKEGSNPRVDFFVVLVGQTPAKWYEVRASHFVRAFGAAKLNIPWESLTEASRLGRWGGLSADPDGRRLQITLRGHHQEVAAARIPHPFGDPTHELNVFGEIQYCTYFDEVCVTQFCFGRRGIPGFQIAETRTEEVDGWTVKTTVEMPISLVRPSVDLRMYEKVSG
jgi:hypothetical protein